MMEETTMTQVEKTGFAEKSLGSEVDGELFQEADQSWGCSLAEYEHEARYSLEWVKEDMMMDEWDEVRMREFPSQIETGLFRRIM